MLNIINRIAGRYGAEIGLRRKLEKFISRQRLASMRTRTPSCIPVVCVVVEGGMNTIRTVLEYVTDSPPVPVVVIQGSGRAADLIAFAHKYAKANEDQDDAVLDQELSNQLMVNIRTIFNLDRLQAEKLLVELLQCVKNKKLVTIFGSFSTSDNAAATTANFLDGKNVKIGDFLLNLI